jgi:hypothetical protein
MTITANIVREEVLTLFEKQTGMEPPRMLCHLLRSLILALCGIWEEISEIRQQQELRWFR